MRNPLLSWDRCPDFSRIQAEHLVPAHEVAANATRATLAAAEARADAMDISEMIHFADSIVDPYLQVVTLSHLLQYLKASPEWFEEMKRAQDRTAGLVGEVNQSLPIYAVVRRLQEGGDARSEAERRILYWERVRSEESGVHLSADDRAQLLERQRRLQVLKAQFSRNVASAQGAWRRLLTDPDAVAGLPNAWRQKAAENAREEGHPHATAADGPWLVRYDGGFFNAFLRYSSDATARRQLYREVSALNHGGEYDNTAIAEEILTLRRQKARMLGYASFAEMVLATKMADSVQTVKDMLEGMLPRVLRAEKADMAELKAFAAEKGAQEGTDFQLGDGAYWRHRLKQERHQLDEEAIKAYFPYPRVRDTLFSLAGRLFGIRIAPADPQPPVWAPGVTLYDVYENETLQGSFYMDPFQRHNKVAGGFSMTIRGRSLRADGSVRQPVACAVFNIMPGTAAQPALLTLNDVTVMFHEFGHVLQSVLTTIPHAVVGGNRGIEWDAIELPSQFMECWRYQPDVLREMARHYETDEPLPEETIQRLIQLKNHHYGSVLLHSIKWSLIDLALHHDYDPESGRTLQSLTEALVRRTTAYDTPLISDVYDSDFIFAHGYASAFYSYLWGEALSVEAFSAFTEEGADQEALGRRFRETFFARGGAQHPMDVFRDFTDRAPSGTSLLEYFNIKE